MSKQPILDSKQAESMLIKAGFILIRTKGSHKIFMKNKKRIVIPFHAGKSLHPKLVKILLEAISENE